MNKITVRQTRIEISNYDIGDVPRLEYIFSIYDKVRHEAYLKGVDYNPDTRILRLPRGIDIPWVEDVFCDGARIDKTYDEYFDTEQIPIKYLTKDNRQLEILKFILGEDKYRYTKSHSQLAINATTGSGKTFVTVAAMCITGSRLALITSSLNWLEQWKDKILEYTPLTEKDIYTISGTPSINKLYARGADEYQVFLISHSSIKSYGDSYGWGKVSDLFKYLKCGMKVFDEAHLYFDNMSKIDYYTNTRKTLYLTATPERSSSDENRIYQLYFKNIPSISLFDENTDPHVNYVALHFNSHPSPFDINRLCNAYGLNRNGYTDYVVKRPKFLELVVVVIEMLLGLDGKSLIYIGTNNAIMEVYEYIISIFPHLVNHIGIYTSLSEKTTKELNLYKKIILSTTKSCGAAQDIANLVCTVNLAEPFKSSVLAKQSLGRCRADNTLYLDIVDNGFFHTKAYYKSKKQVFSVYAKSCKDVYMDDAMLEEKSSAIIEKYKTKKVMCSRIYKE